MEIKGQKGLVFGVKVSGMAAAQVLLRRGAKLWVWDDAILEEPEKVQSALAELTKLGVPAATFDEVRTAPYDFCIVSPGIRSDNPLLLDLETRGVRVLSEVEAAYLISPAPIAAVTGTNGKSTTTVLAGRMLEASGMRTWTGGNLSAEGYDLPLIQAADQAREGDVIAAEISSFQLEQSHNFRPRAAALLNVSPDHMDRYNSFDEYAQAKMRLFQSQLADDIAILGWDDLWLRERSHSITSQLHWFSGTEEVAQGAFMREEQMVLRMHGEEVAFAHASELRLWAHYDRLNVLAAACVARGMGASIDGIHEGAVTFRGLPHRMEHVGTVQGVLWLNNSMCTNPVAGAAAVQAVARKYPVIVLAGGAGKDLRYSAWADAVAASARHLVVFGRDAAKLEIPAREAGLQDVLKAGTLKEAMDLARSVARPGDAVVLAPAMASFDEFQDFRHRGRAFKEIVELFRMEAGD